MTDQNRTAVPRIRRRPAGAPPSGTNRYTSFEGMTRCMIGRKKPAGATYIPTASNQCAVAKASTPEAIAAPAPTAADLK
jgi:hypothetical protein